MSHRIWHRSGVAALMLLLIGAPRPAEACGGTFCDGGPLVMPVEQRGENILFAVDGTHVEAHIQIQYEGEAHRFAWVLPLPAVPDDLRIGSQPLFLALQNGTVPTYGYSTQGCSTFAPAPNGGGVIDGESGGVQTGGPKVVLRETVGAFDVVVLQGGSAVQVSDWLGANGYQDIPTAPAILQKYVERQHVFAAVKLTGGAGVDEIHPLVVRYPGNEPCIPLMLTAVAAVEDMGVRAFFLDTDRTMPVGYKHVVLNPARIDWLDFASNYDEVVSNAVDSAVANGRAFVTEYSGPSNVVPRDGIYGAAWRAAPFVTIAPVAVIDELAARGLASCAGAACEYGHPLLRGLLDQYLPVPAGVDAEAFHSCLACYEDKIDLAAWSGTGFAVDLQERIIVPGRDAARLLDAWPHLTRLYTTISPTEMTEDPFFASQAGLPDVDFRRIATRFIDDDGNVAVRLPDGRLVASSDGLVWPKFGAEMPWAERVEELVPGSDPIVLVDNGSLIDLLAEDQAAQAGWTVASDDPCGNVGGTGAFGAGGTSGSGGINITGGSAGLPASGAAGANAEQSDPKFGASGGCGCRVGGTTETTGAPLLAALLLSRRRRSLARQART